MTVRLQRGSLSSRRWRANGEWLLICKGDEKQFVSKLLVAKGHPGSCILGFHRQQRPQREGSLTPECRSGFDSPWSFEERE